MQNTSPSLTLIGVLQILTRWLGIYAIALVGTIFFMAGMFTETIFLILVAEVFLLLWRPQPSLGAQTYAAPAPAGWQTPIAALRWAGLISGCWTVGVASLVLSVASVVVTIVLAIVAIRSWPYHLGAANFIVLGLLGAWLMSRPIWIGPLRKALKGEASTQFSQYLTSISLIPDGVSIDLRPINVGRLRARQQVFSVGFAELDEVRMMDGLAAQGYLLGLEQYDPTLQVRVPWELFRFLSGQITRPTLCVGVVGLGTHVLMRSSTLLYLIGNADQTAPAIVAAWQAWRNAQQMPAVPTPPIAPN